MSTDANTATTPTSETVTRLTAYGRELAAAGFDVWLTTRGVGRYADGYLQYRNPATGATGSLEQADQFGGWVHLMPIVPSRRYGSAMHLDTATDPWTVAAADECAQLTNRNEVVGTQRNATDRTWRSGRAIALHATPPQTA